MDWQGLERHLLAKHPGDSNKCTRISHALAQAHNALDLLAPMGYQFYLEEGPGPVFPEFPCMMFHVDAAPNGRLVANEFEFDELGNGWFRTLLEAQLWDGTQTQFAGRGGVARQSLPATSAPPSLAEVAAMVKAAEQAKQELIAAFKAGKLNLSTLTPSHESLAAG